MDDFPEHEPPRFWIAFSMLVAAVVLAVLMLAYLTTRADAQEQPLCAPAEVLLRQFSEIHKERPIWEGVVPQETGPIEIILLQGEKNTWTMFTIRGGIACIIASGQDANPSLSDKGV